MRRPILPFDDLHIDVDLRSVIQEWGDIPAPTAYVQPLSDWIEDGWVDLFVVSPYHILSTEDRPFVYDTSLQNKMSGNTSKHRELCVLAGLYLLSLGKEVYAGGNSLCSYAGGWGDVIAQDGSIVVECGTLRANKPFLAMCAGQTLMVIPYASGGDLDQVTIDRLSAALPPYKSESVPEGASKKLAVDFKTLERLMQPQASLGFIFVPKQRLQPSPFDTPLGLR